VVTKLQQPLGYAAATFIKESLLLDVKARFNDGRNSMDCVVK
jgi:hypothetical protein